MEDFENLGCGVWRGMVCFLCWICLLLFWGKRFIVWEVEYEEGSGWVERDMDGEVILVESDGMGWGGECIEDCVVFEEGLEGFFRGFLNLDFVLVVFWCFFLCERMFFLFLFVIEYILRS